MNATQEQIAELANAIAGQAQAIAEGRTSASPHAAAQLILENADTLVAWTMPHEDFIYCCTRCGERSNVNVPASVLSCPKAHRGIGHSWAYLVKNEAV